MKRITFITILFSFIFTSQVLADDLVVVELFTSQGCEKCPPANKLMEELGHDKTVLTLSWHVDYWDFMGWRDTLAKPEFSERQKAYNKALERKGVYTPQVIINGRREVAGTNKLGLYEKIRSSIISNEMPMKVRFEGGLANLKIRIKGPNSASGAVVKLIWLESLQRIKINAGNNAGRTINYVNIVKNTKNIGVWQGGELTIVLNLDGPERAGADRIAILIQKGESGPIIGAAKFDLNGRSSN